jgi:hypothetical protein
MTEFWVSSGHHLTTRASEGGLAVTDELILAYLARPELTPPLDADTAERSLHRRLMEAPRRAIAAAEITAIEDPDARQNWGLMIAFRDRLLAAPTVEAAYLGLIRNGVGQTPPLFINQLVHLILRNALDGCTDAYLLRAAELFFRTQRATVHEGALLLADTEAIEGYEAERRASPLLGMLGRPAVAELDVLDDASAYSYWSRSDAFTMVLNLGSDPKSRAALARVIEIWTKHLLDVTVTVEPLAQLRDEDWRWFVGLDAEGTRLGNTLWSGAKLDDAARSRVLALFRLSFAADAAVAPNARGKPVYLILAMDADRTVRLKPQNLITGLPLAQPAALV